MTQGALAQHIRPLLQSCNTAIFSVKKAFPFGCLVWNASHLGALFLTRFGNDLFPLWANLGTTALLCRRAANATDSGLNRMGSLAII
jgi:hypothetical protein